MHACTTLFKHFYRYPFDICLHFFHLQEVVVEMWRHFLDSVLSECVTANHNSKEIEGTVIPACTSL